MGGDSNTTDNMVIIEKCITYQRTFLIVAGSLLASLVWIVVAGTSGGQDLQSSVYEIAEGAVAHADYQVDSANLALTKDIFGFGAVSENDNYCRCDCNCDPWSWQRGCKCTCPPAPAPY